ncbi:unnamed protein product [Cuscuta campestris]|uniref:Retrotransposon gag domain-containing protein n=1 Tax=Cuscuta campestris TaxID=132261 RepID=A0A484MNN0_9ASTE|nr:unnamed protein product [Cuscuta campestris]
MLEGLALDWFRWRQRNHLLDSWADFVTNFKLRFDPFNYVDSFRLLSKVQQIKTVLENLHAFEKILVNVPAVDETNLQSLFHAGLKPHLQHEIMLQKPTSLSSSFALARELEAKHAAWATSIQPRVPPRHGPWVFGKTASPPLATTLLPTLAGIPDNNANPTHPIRRLTYAEKREWDAKGLCYNCDEKWVKGHRCGRFLFLLEDDEMDESLPPEESDNIVMTADVSSLNSMVGVMP